MIEKFIEEYHFLSDSFLLMGNPIKYDGRMWISLKHLYNGLKTDNKIVRDGIREAATPAEAEQLGRKVKLRPGWTGMRLDVRRLCLKLKFSSPKLRDKLLATGDELLVNGNEKGETFWGVCDGKGENNDGKLLMALRGYLRRGEEPWPVFNKCLVCEHARRAGAQKYVGCARWIKEAMDYTERCNRIGKTWANEGEFYRGCITPQVLEVMSTGWVYLKKRPEHKDSPNDTADTGTMTNNMIVVPESFRCGEYQARLNY